MSAKARADRARRVSGYQTNAAYKKTPIKKAFKGHSAILAAKLTKRINRKVTVGPLFYSLRALSSCKLKCVLSMRDGAGQRLSVTFFKAGFEKQLRSKKGRATVTGIVKSRGKNLILQRVQ
jgi:hypothetical protein